MKLLGIGAHYDDCVFGIPGTLLRAVDEGHQVTVLSVIGDYRNWAPVGEDGQARMIDGVNHLFETRGIDHRFLDYPSMGVALSDTAKADVSRIVAEVAPDVGFMLWPSDSHPDHEVVSQLSKVGFNWASTVLRDIRGFRPPARVYYYDNGPRHTFGFEPNSFVDVGVYWDEAVDWLRSVMAFVLDEERATKVVESKTTLAAYRGKSCGVTFAEGLRSFQNYPMDILAS